MYDCVDLAVLLLPSRVAASRTVVVPRGPVLLCCRVSLSAIPVRPWGVWSWPPHLAPGSHLAPFRLQPSFPCPSLQRFLSGPAGADPGGP